MNKTGQATVDSNESVRLSQIAMYALLLAPISISTDGMGVSANYLFGLLLFSPHGYQNNTNAVLYLLFIVLSFVVGALLFSRLDEEFLLRQAASFGLSVIGVSLLFVRLTVRLEEFVIATVVAGLVYSTFAIYMIAANGFSLTDIYFIKSGLREYVTDWPQRYTVVLLFSFFVGVARWGRGIRWQLASALILSCIYLTFTRGAWLAVILGAFAYLLNRSGSVAAGRPIRSRIYLSIGCAFFSGLLLYAFRNALLYSAAERMFDSVLQVAQSRPAAYDIEGSDGARLALWSSIWTVVQVNPFSGTGFAGTYLVLEGSGSAHSQYLDVLLRTGLIGLFFYFIFWKKLFAVYRHDPGVFSGLVALSVFGCFHETTKLSYGALIFFVLLNKAYDTGRPLQLYSRGQRATTQLTPLTPYLAERARGVFAYPRR